MFRTEIFIWVLLDMFPVVITMLTWIAVYRGTGHAISLSISQLLLYYIAVMLISDIAETHIEEDWVDEVRHGRIDHLLTKPTHFIAYLFMIQLSYKFIELLIFLGPGLLLIWLFSSLHYIVLPTLSAPVMAIFVLFLIGAMFMNFIFSCFVILAAFWFDESRSLAHLKWMLSGIFGGTIAPLIFYPQWIQRVAVYLPFMRMQYLPATMLSQQIVTPGVWFDVAILFGFVAVMGVLLEFTWRAAARKYTAAGG